MNKTVYELKLIRQAYQEALNLVLNSNIINLPSFKVLSNKIKLCNHLIKMEEYKIQYKIG